jgi:hypothetical protein
MHIKYFYPPSRSDEVVLSPDSSDTKMGSKPQKFVDFPKRTRYYHRSSSSARPNISSSLIQATVTPKIVHR